ncbi:BQ5605_C010g06195 [Microbotryum silenes-dioicae]|uniref:BQ5605_C010g06195 protein n=1 Tax=Microbotryum silenes-dioicae TaxID=796604 RepID=A0A2X0NTN4_9BASI|nr:BQ5605_C010g06195 [Microbotryum silenes-dioicae]
MVEQGGSNTDGTGVVFHAAGLPITAPSAHDRQTSRAAQVSPSDEGGRASRNQPQASAQTASWTPAKRLLPEELYEQAYSVDTRDPNKTEREQHKAWAVQRTYDALRLASPRWSVSEQHPSTSPKADGPALPASG